MNPTNPAFSDSTYSDRFIPNNYRFPGHENAEAPKNRYQEILAESLGLCVDQPLIWSVPKPYTATVLPPPAKPIPFALSIGYKPHSIIDVPPYDYDFYSHRLAQRGQSERFAISSANLLYIGSTTTRASYWSTRVFSDEVSIRCLRWQQSAGQHLAVGTEKAFLYFDLQQNKQTALLHATSPLNTLTSDQAGIIFLGNKSGTVETVDLRERKHRVLMSAAPGEQQICGFLEPDSTGHSLIFSSNHKHIANLDLRMNKVASHLPVSTGVRALCRIPGSSDFLIGTGNNDKRVIRLNAALELTAEYASSTQVRCIQAIGEHFLVGYNGSRLDILDKNLKLAGTHGNSDLHVQGLAYDVHNGMLAVFSCDSYSETASESQADTLTFSRVTSLAKNKLASYPASQIR